MIELYSLLIQLAIYAQMIESEDAALIKGEFCSC